MAESSSRRRGPATAIGINHLVINVRDMDESHAFYTEVAGLEQVAELTGRPSMKMRFYSGRRDGNFNHHDLALIERTELSAAKEARSDSPKVAAIHHLAIAFPDRESWMDHLAYLQERGIKFERRVNHGASHSAYISDPNGYGVELLYEMPRELWEGDLDAAANHIENLPTQGEGALVDREGGPHFGR